MDRAGWSSGSPAGLSALPPPPAPPAEPPQGRVGEVEEADIYRVADNKLYYLNTYRGFIIYDISDPKQPKLISRPLALSSVDQAVARDRTSSAHWFRLFPSSSAARTALR